MAPPKPRRGAPQQPNEAHDRPQNALEPRPAEHSQKPEERAEEPVAGQPRTERGLTRTKTWMNRILLRTLGGGARRKRPVS